MAAMDPERDARLAALKQEEQQRRRQRQQEEQDTATRARGRARLEVERKRKQAALSELKARADKVGGAPAGPCR